MYREPVGNGQKLQNIYHRPFIVVEHTSSHLVLLKNPGSGKLVSKLVYVNRLKLLHVTSFYSEIILQSDYFQ